MIAISLLFVRMLCDCFKSRRRLEAEILCFAAARTTSSAFALGRPCRLCLFSPKTIIAPTIKMCIKQRTNDQRYQTYA